MSLNPVASLGSQGLKVARLGYGCMSLCNTFYGDSGLTEEEAIQVIRSAYDQGIRLFNTSALYGPYDNEVLVGKALEDKPDAIIATKWGDMIYPDRGFVLEHTAEFCLKVCTVTAFDPTSQGVSLLTVQGQEALRAYNNYHACHGQSCHGALERLRRPSIDLFTLRGPVAPDCDFDATCRTLKGLVEQGKIKYVGMSEVSAEYIRRAHAIVPISAVEFEWSLFTRDAEKDIVPTCRELGIGILAYSPLGRGLLTGAIRSPDQLSDKDFRKTFFPRFSALDKNLVLVSEVERIAAAKGATPGQVALAWLMSRGDDVFPIPGTKRVKYLTENMGALDVKLTQEDITHLEQLADKVEGTRYKDMTHTTYHGSGHAIESAHRKFP